MGLGKSLEHLLKPINHRTTPRTLFVCPFLDRTPYDNKHVNLMAWEKRVAGMLNLARVQFLNNPVVWSHSQD